MNTPPAADKPFAPACERNAVPIGAQLQSYLPGRKTLLEIGSGTGQHAAALAGRWPQLQWQTSDVAAQLPGIRNWLYEAGLPNTPAPLILDLNDSAWPRLNAEVLFSANTLHIISWPQVQTLFQRLDPIIEPGGLLIIYGPFKYRGEFTSASNAGFDAQLKAADRQRGIRDAEAVDELAAGIGLTLLADHAMPANNQMRVWQR